MPRLDDDVRRIRYGGRSMCDQLRQMIGNLMNPHRRAQRLFYGDDGRLKPDAVDWFAELADRNFVNGGGFSTDPLQLAANTARRELVLEMMGSLRLDTAKLDQLTRQLREVEDGRD